MRRLVTIAAIGTLLLALTTGTVLAKVIVCHGSTPCRGTDRADTMTGTNGPTDIYGLDGPDTIDGGDIGFDATIAAHDYIYGGRGSDTITDNTGRDNDQIYGGRGNDTIDVREGDTSKDFVYCGPGTDTVFIDDLYDEIHDCEIVNP